VSHTARLAELGIALPPVAPPLASYVPAVRTGNLVFTAGQLPLVDGALTVTGHLGADVEVEVARSLARTCALNGLAAVAAILPGGIDDIVRVVRVVGYVASTPEFTQQPAVVNGASEVLGEIFPGAGGHARSAVGVAVLPLGAPVEVELTCEVR
jgi:enamine deaminase RidA (YjgF/YER057c/UK114 family)